MKQDIAIVTDNFTGDRDIALGSDGDLLATTGFDSAIDNSLMVNHRAATSEVIQPWLRRGWIGDLASKNLGFEVGSKLWLFEQRRTTPEVLNDIRDAAQKSLEWLIEDGSASNVSVAIELATPHVVILRVDVFAYGTNTTRYVNLWNKTGFDNAN